MATPLNELLSAALADGRRGFERAAGDGLKGPALESHLNLLRLLPADVRDLPRVARVSKRAAHYNVVVAKRFGWATGDKHVELTTAGRTTRATCERCIGSAEEEWRDRFGDDAVAKLRSSLENLVGRFDLELPHHPVGYGPADSSATGGVAMRWGRGHALRVKGLPGRVFDPQAERAAAEAWERQSGGRLYVRETGQDWRPVRRGEGDTVSALPLFALLSQALMAFAIDFEGCGGLSMARSGNFLRHFGDDGVEIAVRESRGKGMSPSIPVDGAFAGLERHAYAEVTIDPADKRKGRLRLTEKGRAIRDAYADIVVDVERRWKGRYGAAVVRDVRGALTKIVSA